MIAKLDSLHLQLPVNQSRVTAIGYQGGSADALGVDPARHAGEPGAAAPPRTPHLRRRLRHAPLVPAARRPGTGHLGARRRRPCRHRRLRTRRRHGRRDRGRRAERPHPTARASTSSRPAQPSLVVSISHVRVDPALTVGATVTAAGSKLGTRRRLLARRAPGARALHERLGQPRRRRGSPLGGPLAGLALRILFVADVFGAPGRRAVETRLPSLREELGVDFCIVNGENAAAGRGITAQARGQAARRRRRRRSRSATGPGASRASRRTSPAPTASCGRRTSRRTRPASASPCTTASP